MKIIFNCETEIGNHDHENNQDCEFKYAEPSYSTIVAQTQAALSKGIMRIEQRCFLRNGQFVADESWGDPQTIFEPAFSTEAEIVELASIMHEQYLYRMRRNLLPRYQFSRRDRAVVFA